MKNPNNTKNVLELRVALTADDYERMVDFYRLGLGLEPSQVWPSDQGRSLVLDLGRATLEVFDEKQAQTVDMLEVGRRTSGKFRFALQVSDLDAAIARLTSHGAKLVSPPVETPWGDRVVRFEDPEGMQITLYQAPDRSTLAVRNVIDSPDDRQKAPINHTTCCLSYRI